MDIDQPSRKVADDKPDLTVPAAADTKRAKGNSARSTAVEATPPQATAGAPAAVEPAPSKAKAQPFILYVEDDALSCEVMRLLLQRELGYSELTIIDDNHGFMDKVRALSRVPDVIFLDIQMYPYDGYEMLKMLRDDDAYHDCQIIAMTASVMATDVEALKKAGFSGLIGKPIMRAAFPEQLEQILAGKAVWFVS